MRIAPAFMRVKLMIITPNNQEAEASFYQNFLIFHSLKENITNNNHYVTYPLMHLDTAGLGNKKTGSRLSTKNKASYCLNF